jgi:cytochrome c biogenesis protein CcmG, thiol:disulfide interchange protein DsbE
MSDGPPLGDIAKRGANSGARLAFMVPLVVFLALAGLFASQLLSGRDNTTVPSALIGRLAPTAPLGVLDGLPLFDPSARGNVMIVNIWASWCAPCREEHPLLLELTKDSRFVLAGINYKDGAANALGFLAELSNPYDVIGTDPNGRAAIEWGVYGVPETFIVGRDGTIRHKHVGPLDADDLQGAFGEALKTALDTEADPRPAAQP